MTRRAVLNRKTVFRRALALLLPLVSFAVVVGSQALIPPILQLRLSEAEYSAYVVVSAAAGFVGMADGGMMLPLLRELTALHGGGRLGEYAGELRRATKIYSFAALGGFVTGGVALMAALPALGASWPHALDEPFLWASGAVLLATSVRLLCATQHTAFLLSQGRYVLAQLLGITSNLAPAATLATALAITRDLPVSLAWQAFSIVVQGALQATHGIASYRAQFVMTSIEKPRRAFASVLFEGLTLKIGDSLAVFGLPNALAILNVALVPAAMPARTLINSCRLITQAFASLLEVRTMRNIATQSSAQFEEFRIAANTISSLQVAALGTLDLLAGVVFSIWLPLLAPSIRNYLPGLLAEQALFSAILPTSSLLVASGRFRAMGMAKLVGALLGIALLTATIGLLPQAAFGLACAATVVPFVALGAWAEFSGGDGFPPAGPETWVRYTRAVIVSGSYLLYAWAPLLPAAIAIVSSLPTLMIGGWAILQRVRGRVAAPALM